MEQDTLDDVHVYDPLHMPLSQAVSHTTHDHQLHCFGGATWHVGTTPHTTHFPLHSHKNARMVTLYQINQDFLIFVLHCMRLVVIGILIGTGKGSCHSNNPLPKIGKPRTCLFIHTRQPQRHCLAHMPSSVGTTCAHGWAHMQATFVHIP